MQLRLLTILTCTAIAGCVGSHYAPVLSADSAPLIERSKLQLGTPSLQFGRVSPDGQWVSWLAAHNGVMNLWIAPAASPDKSRLLTQEKVDRIARYFWSPDSASVFYT